jgi:hypothetical protein
VHKLLQAMQLQEEQENQWPIATGNEKRVLDTIIKFVSFNIVSARAPPRPDETQRIPHV